MTSREITNADDLIDSRTGFGDDMSNLYIQETFVNATAGYQYGESDVYETFTEDRGELFRSLQKEYGRCIGRVNLETEQGDVMGVGWVFQGRTHYEDSRETYLREVWVTVHSGPPVRTVEYHYSSGSPCRQ